MEDRPVTHQEIMEVKGQLLTLTTKLEGMAGSLRSIENLLAEQKGERFPIRIGRLEDEFLEMKTYSAAREWLPKAVTELQVDMKASNKFQYLLTGGMMLINAFMIIGGKFLLDKLFGN